jgi:hypothetical protein
MARSTIALRGHRDQALESNSGAVEKVENASAVIQVTATGGMHQDVEAGDTRVTEEYTRSSLLVSSA